LIQPTDLKRVIFVFGSNLAGRHGRGAAKDAHYLWGAAYGTGSGPTGNAYAIPTKDENLKVLELDEIEPYVKEFVKYANKNRKLLFYVTAFGTGLAGYTVEQIKPLFGPFHWLPHNIVFTKDWMI
jgi:hypothetical protein